jgi:integrase/recombinase XerD
MTNELDFWQTRKDFLAHLSYIKGYSPHTCYNYNSDLGIFGRWLEEMGKDWWAATHVDIEQFAGWQMRVRKVSAHIVSRRSACLGTFYKWAMKGGLLEKDPVYLADKPKRPHRIPVWLEKEEQQTLQKALRNTDDLPKNIFGRTREHIKGVRVRYDFLFALILNSGLRISEALSVRVRDVRVVDGVARSVRVIGKGNRERLVPLPKEFGQVFGFWLSDKPKEDFVFAKEPRRQADRSSCGSRLPAAAHRSCGHRQEGHASQAPAHLRYTVARVWRGACGHPGAARACEPGDHADLYACERGSDGGGGGEAIGPA